MVAAFLWGRSLVTPDCLSVFEYLAGGINQHIQGVKIRTGQRLYVLLWVIAQFSSVVVANSFLCKSPTFARKSPALSWCAHTLGTLGYMIFLVVVVR